MLGITNSISLAALSLQGGGGRFGKITDYLEDGYIECNGKTFSEIKTFCNDIVNNGGKVAGVYIDRMNIAHLLDTLVNTNGSINSSTISSVQAGYIGAMYVYRNIFMVGIAYQNTNGHYFENHTVDNDSNTFRTSNIFIGKMIE